MVGNATLFGIIVSLFVVLRYGRWLLSRKIVRAPIEKRQPVPWLWAQERALLVLWGVLIVRSLTPVLLVHISPPLATMPIGTLGENSVLRVGGLVVLAVAIFFQLRAKWELGANWSNAVEGPIVREGAVTTRGLYRWSRNPMYCGSLAEAIALILMLQNAAAVGLGVLTYCYVRANVAREEALLRDVKGAEYARYCRTVPRFLW